MNAKSASKIPLEIGEIHFVGIGGIGMSGIAEILHCLGYTVRGSDISANYNTERLKQKGIGIKIGHQASNIENAAVVVISTAVKADNPEVIAAREKRIPVVRRSEMLAELMRLKTSIAVGGTHGKTTTTSMIATLLDEFDPTVINGGIIKSYGTNVRLGASDWMVVEADESDGTFIKIPSTIAVITNMDPEHLDHWGNFEAVKTAYRMFIDNIPFYGFGVACIDHPEVQKLVAEISERRIITYGLNPQAEVRAVNIRKNQTINDKVGSLFDVEISSTADNKSMKLQDVFLPVLGEHNITNSLAAISVATKLGISEQSIKQTLSGFNGVKRRFTITGEVEGITIVDDYGHHPVEISATLKAGREFISNKEGANVIAVFQPHRYSRVNDLFKEFCSCFNDADYVLVSDIYAAGEAAIEGISPESIVDGLKRHGHKNPIQLKSPAELASEIDRLAKSGDVVICLGAGTITNWAASLPQELEKLKSSKKQKEVA